MLNPPAPQAVIVLIKCCCKKGCSSNKCSCRKNQMVCTDACGCSESSNSCANTQDLTTPLALEDLDLLDDRYYSGKIRSNLLISKKYQMYVLGEEDAEEV